MSLSRSFSTHGSLLAMLATLVVLSGCKDDWRHKSLSEEGSGSSQIAIIDINGPISFASKGLLEGGQDGASAICRRLRMAECDDDVKGVILSLNTPGGDVVASDAIAQGVRAVRAKGKPVVALQTSVSASGGYYIACAADRILCGKGTITGSIGVIMVTPEVHDLASKIGVSMNVITSGPHKDSGSPFKTMSEEERALFQGMINQVYGQFLAVVVDGRKGRGPVPAAADQAMAYLKPLADGRVFTGEDAVANGLADVIGHLPEAIDQVKTLAKLDEVTVFRYEENRVIFGIIAENQNKPMQVTNGIHIDAGSLLGSRHPTMSFLWQGY